MHTGLECNICLLKRMIRLIRDFEKDENKQQKLVRYVLQSLNEIDYTKAPAHNGMYRNERLVHGGAYAPSAAPSRTIVRGGPLYREMSRIGWTWGGDEVDALGYADYMHFSRR